MYVCHTYEIPLGYITHEQTMHFPLPGTACTHSLLCSGQSSLGTCISQSRARGKLREIGFYEVYVQHASSLLHIVILGQQLQAAGGTPCPCKKINNRSRRTHTSMLWGHRQTACVHVCVPPKAAASTGRNKQDPEGTCCLN